METRTPHPTDVSDEEWAFVAAYLALMTLDTPRREHDLRDQPSAVVLDARTLQSTPERVEPEPATTGTSG